MLKIKSKTQKGITLIALIVTIIVLLILAGVSINMVFSNGGILDKAKSAEKRSTIAKEKEIVEMAYLAVSTENVGGEITLDDLQAEIENMVGANKTVTTLDENGYLLVKFLETGNEYNINEMGVSKSEEKFSEIATETKIYTDENGRTAIIPKGFAVGTSSTINKVDNGLVIQDKDGNQFVWIPAVGYVGNGFYVGRYEAGLASDMSEFTSTQQQTESNQIYNLYKTPQSKAGLAPWDFVDWTHSKANAESMYNNNYVSSGLITGTQWDVILNTLKSKASLSDSDMTNSSSWGNYKNTAIDYTGRKATAYYSSNYWYLPIFGSTEKSATTFYSDNYGDLLTTGASSTTEKYHIFDIAGNLWEWTEEDSHYATSGQYRVRRGGCYLDASSGYPACYRLGGGAVSWDGCNLGFRAVLYIK